MHMASIDDEAAPAVGIGERGAHGARLAMAEGRHRVEEMRHAGDAAAQRPTHLLEGPVRVPRGDHDTFAGEEGDRLGCGHLGGERDQSPADAQRSEQRRIAHVEVADLRRIVRAAAQLVDERPFDVDAGDSGHSGPHGVAHCAHRARDDDEVLADEGGQESGRAEAAMGGSDRADRFHARVVVEEHAAAAVHLRVEEAGKEGCASEVAPARRARARVVAPDEGDDASRVDEDATLLHESVVREHPRVDEQLHDHIVRVTLARCGGSSGSRPRAIARALAAR